jgi:hypothetical protein
VAPGRDLGGGRDVRLVGERRGVEHDRAEPEPHGLVDEFRLGRVVEVDRDGHLRGARDGEGACADRAEAAVVADAVLADLQDDGSTRPFRPRGDRLGMLEADHVEGPRADPAAGGGGDDLAGSRRVA